MPKRFGILTILTLAACVETHEENRVDAIRGKQLFSENCAVCHGPNAEGAGDASLGLGTPPPGLRQLSQRNGGVFPRDYVMGTIDGLERHETLDAAMPEFGAGNLGPLIQVEEDGHTVPTPAKLLALAAYLETIQD